MSSDRVSSFTKMHKFNTFKLVICDYLREKEKLFDTDP
jgi:hypothetical protein